MINEYYVYVYLREIASKTAEAGTPYYVGKGKGRRSKVKHVGVTVPPKHRILIIQDNMSEDDAHSLETKLIQEYGRIDLETGILRNLTNGGEGKSGWKPSEETLRKMTLAQNKNQLTLLSKNVANFSPNFNPNKIRVSCIVCQKETSLPSLKNHRRCNGELPYQNTKTINVHNPSKTRISCVICHKETGISGFSQHFRKHLSDLD